MSRVEATHPALSAWRFITVFGAVSLLADFVYEGAGRLPARCWRRWARPVWWSVW
jgi:hypothetical protein